MAESQFIPDTTDFAGQFYRGAEFGQNFMQRRQRQQWESEDREEAKRARDLFAPVLQAQQQAQLATALSSLETNKQQQQLRTRFAAEAPVYMREFQAAMEQPTFAGQQAALAQLQPKVTWMEAFPDGKAFVDRVYNNRAMAFQSQVIDQRIQGTLTEIEARNAGDREEIILRGNQARETAQLVANEQRTTNAARPRSSDPAQRDAERIRYLREQANAIRDLDPETAALFDQRAAYLANPAGAGGVGGDPFDSWAGGATATAPVTPATTSAPATPAAPVETQAVIDSIKF